MVWILRCLFSPAEGNRRTRKLILFYTFQKRAKLALGLKNKGNKAFSSKRFTEAIEYYTQAIECEEQAVFYSNRAACWSFRLLLLKPSSHLLIRLLN